MSIRITCPACNASYPVDDEMSGKKVRCRKCEKAIAVPMNNREADVAVFDPKGKGTPPPLRGDKPAGRRDRDASGVRKPQKKGSMVLPLVLIGGGLAVVAVVVVVVLLVGGGIVSFFALRAPNAPARPGSFQAKNLRL